MEAQYHSIYFIILPPIELSRGHYELVLRVAGNHLPNIKTKNEIGVMTWLSKNTTIPLPEVIAYHDSAYNPVGHEYILLSRIQGVTLSDVYDRLSDEQVSQILNQLIDFLAQLQAYPWDGIGGLTLDDQGEVQLGPMVDETFCQVPDIKALWPEGDSGDPEHRRTIQDLAFMRDIVPRLEAFVASLPKHANELNNVKLRLAHKDLHFANMMFDSLPGKITGILDWEFAGVVPYPQWNPRSSFLWNGTDTPESLDEEYRLLEVFKQRCKKEGCKLLEETGYTSPLQEDMQRAVDFLRAIVEVSPRGQRQELVQGWKDMVLENIAKFGAQLRQFC
ncbi:hypothetical protein AU210_012084 [Fusarium oxysporum f. sp. radicis-cucumerinum]|uniref:Aminoglycoside phosphotransferase domain-containing protein n=1 Tax=Fusarium oxysporum f. sp. radicis-cucumerinum TaxID=327505 RepID=A0A2H3GPA3_FUSOX|nr:hypothetical protein AU210_012084 [Fusarium oxysporum f. sp. radicis-cucumerinum]